MTRSRKIISLATVLYYSRQYDRAIEQAHRTIELDPYFGMAHDVLANCYIQEGRYEEAIFEINKQSALGRGPILPKLNLVFVYTGLGKRAEAISTVKELVEISKKEPIALDVAQAYSALGESDKAFEWIEKAFSVGHRNGSWTTMKTGPVWDNLRSDPRFASVLRRIGLAP
ncbi:MAG: tetratricopeptide repeat protein [Acidobacteria bacterium]|nr:tetratricopeptide repeat protein [Acidobacteriota bacterium]